MKMLNSDEARKLFEKTTVGRLGCIVDGGPYVVPINFHLEGEHLYSHSLPGLKINGLRENPLTCVQVDEILDDLQFKSAIAFGHFEEITNEDGRQEILGKLLRRFPMLTPVESALVSDGSPPPVIVFRIKIDRFSGVAEGYDHPIHSL